MYTHSFPKYINTLPFFFCYCLFSSHIVFSTQVTYAFLHLSVLTKGCLMEIPLSQTAELHSILYNDNTVVYGIDMP